MEYTVGIIALAFGQQGGDTPSAGPSNEQIGAVTEEIASIEERDGFSVLVSAQWETAITLKPELNAHSVSSFDGPMRGYIDTREAISNSLQYFNEHGGVDRVIIVAHPLHMMVIKLMIKTAWKELFEDVEFDDQHYELLSSIPYDRSPGNTQWWTGNPVMFITYLVKVQLTKKHGT